MKLNRYINPQFSQFIVRYFFPKVLIYKIDIHIITIYFTYTVSGAYKKCKWEKKSNGKWKTEENIRYPLQTFVFQSESSYLIVEDKHQFFTSTVGSNNSYFRNLSTIPTLDRVSFSARETPQIINSILFMFPYFVTLPKERDQILKIILFM